MKKVIYIQLSLLLILLSVGFLSAQSTWTGNTDTDWDNPGNWTAGVPDAADDVTIPNVATNDPVILSGTVAEALSINVATSAKLTLDAGGKLYVDGSAGDGISIFGEVDNAGEIIVGLNQIIGARGVYISYGTVSNHFGATIQVEETTSHGIHFEDGTFTNSGVITLGANKKVGGHAVFNERALTNNADGLIQIEETGGSGIYSNPWSVHFTNAGMITIGVNKKVNGHGIYNEENFTNAAGATIQIEETGGSGINNVETFSRWFSNAGTITIGVNKKTGQTGIRNYHSQFSNSGTIQIEETGGDGIYTDRTFNNSSSITLGVNKKVGGIGFNNDANTFNNSGTLQIEETGSHGVHNDWAAKFNNSGLVTIGANKKVGGIGYSTYYGYLNNYAGATIQIEETGSHGYYSETAIATNNYGTITFGVNKKVGGTGIYNEVNGNSPFRNHPGGVIQIEETAGHGIYNTDGSVLINEGNITIGAIKPVGIHGIVNNQDAEFNNNGGEISIDRTPQAALVNSKVSYNQGSFTNTGSITIGAFATVGTYGIINNHNFQNNTGGEINIDQTTSGAIMNQTGGTFTNLADITIGASAPVGNFGIENQASFSNNGGEIKIDNAHAGLKNTSGTFTNLATLNIGITTGPLYDGIWNQGTFTNNPNGEINIDNSSFDGILNEAGSFTNQGAITLGPNAGSGITGLFNFTDFTNSACATFTSFVPILISSGTVSNGGLFTINTANGHGNTGAFINNGVIVYPQGNPVQNVTNNDLIVVPIAGECSFANALQIGEANDFAISANWYTDPGLGNVAGDYTPNTFSITNLSEGSHTLYFTVTGNGGLFTPSIQVDHDDVTPPAPLCKTGTVELGPDGNYNLTENDVLDGGTDNCGSVNFVSMSHSSVSCANVNTTIEVTVNTNDGKGNDKFCTATLTVVDNTPPSIDCPGPITADVDAGVCCAELSIAAPTGSDNCTTLTFSNDYNGTDDGSDIYFPGETIVTWTATDGSGHTAMCEQSVTVVDNEAPVLGYAEEACYAEYEVCLDDQATHIAELLAELEVFIENCNGDPACLHLAAIEAVKIDEKARKRLSRCYFILRSCEVIPVENNTLPDIVVNAPDGSCEIELNPGPVVMENCAAFTLSNDYNDTDTGEGTYPVGTVVVTWTAVDQYGNTSTVSRSITVVDAEDPVISCPDITVDNDPGECGATVTLEVTATDNCGATTVDYSPASGSFFPVGSTTVSATATDEAGNDASCTFTVTVNGEGDADCDDVPDACDVCPGGDDNGPCDAESFPGFDNIPDYWKCHPNGKKVSICHNGNTLCVNENAVQAHLNHGDFLGPCTSCQQGLAAPNTGFNTTTASAERVELELFPNPANREVNVHLHGLDGEAATLTVLDQLGRAVYQRELDGSDQSLSIELNNGNFAQGRYFVRVVSEETVLTKSLIIQR